MLTGRSIISNSTFCTRRVTSPSEWAAPSLAACAQGGGTLFPRGLEPPKGLEARSPMCGLPPL